MEGREEASQGQTAVELSIMAQALGVSAVGESPCVALAGPAFPLWTTEIPDFFLPSAGLQIGTKPGAHTPVSIIQLFNAL